MVCPGMTLATRVVGQRSVLVTGYDTRPSGDATLSTIRVSGTDSCIVSCCGVSQAEMGNGVSGINFGWVGVSEVFVLAHHPV